MRTLKSLMSRHLLKSHLHLSRLSRLLHKHRFAEAESFAIQFGLDVEVSIHSFRGSQADVLGVLEDISEEMQRVAHGH